MIWIRSLNTYGTHVGGALLLLSALLIGADVLLRRTFAITLGGADELAGYCLALGSAMGFGAALLDRAHVRIDSLYMLFPAFIQRVFDLIGLILFTTFFVVITLTGAELAYQSMELGSRSNSALQLYLFVPQALWVVGLTVCVLTGFVLLVTALNHMRHGALSKAGALIGTKSAGEEVAEEIQDLQRTTSTREVHAS